MDSDSSSSYIPSSSDEDVDISDSEIEEEESDMDTKAGPSEEKEDDVDVEEETVHGVLNLESLKSHLEKRRSINTAEVLAYAEEENTLIAEILKLILQRLDNLNEKKLKTPRRLVEHSKDSWIHIIEVISDHIEDAAAKAKRC